MSDIEKAKLFNVSGPIDRPKRSGEGISVMFNPSSLKVTLANSLKENERSGNSRAAQYVDKSSSSLTVELIFDTTDADEHSGGVRDDVRKHTGTIAKEFMQQKGVGDKKAEPKRCMFVWGTFVFVGIMESFDETLDYFSAEGTPLRSTVGIKMTESRFQFESEAAKQAKRTTPRLGRGSDSAPEATADAGQDPKNWRDTSLYNGVESPRQPGSSALAVPPAPAAQTPGGLPSGGAPGSGENLPGLNGNNQPNSGIGGLGGSGPLQPFSSDGAPSIPGGGPAPASPASSPAFRFGASQQLGTGIPGAFSPDTRDPGGYTAGSLLAMSGLSPGSTGATGKAMGSGTPRTRRQNLRGTLPVPRPVVKPSTSLGFD